MKLRLFCRSRILALSLAMCGTFFFLTFVAAESRPQEQGSRASEESNPYNIEVQRIEARFPGTNAAETAVLLHRAYELRDYVDDAAALDAWITAAADQPFPALVRDEALYLGVSIDLHHNRIQAAERKLTTLGFVRRWASIGPFPAQDMYAQVGPEGGFDSARAYRDSDGAERRWHLLPDTGPHSWIDLGDIYSRPGAVTVLLATSVYSESTRRVALRFSADSAVALWMDGQQVAFAAENSGLGLDQHAVTVELRAGWNELLVKLHRSGGQDWRFSLRVTGIHGGGIALLAEPRQHHVPETSAPTPPLPLVEDLVALADMVARKQPESAAALDTLAGIELAHRTGSPLAHLEAAARLAPTAERWYAMARLENENAAKFQALSTAIAAEPRFVPARLALAEYYAGRGQLEKARELLQEAIRISPGDFVARKCLADIYAAAGLNSRAGQDYAEIAEHFPHPLWVKREIARAWEDEGLLAQAQALLDGALRGNADGAAEIALAIRIAGRRRDVAALEAAYQQARRLSPTDTLNLARMAELQAGSGRYPEAKSTLATALAIDPENEDLHQRLAEVLASSGDAAGSRRELERTLALNPRREDLRRRLEDSSRPASQDPDATYLVDAAKLAAEAQRQSAESGADAVRLAEVRIQHVYANGLSSTQVQQVTLIGSEQGARDYSADAIQYAPDSQQLRVLRARVYKADGRIVDGELAGESAVSEARAGMYYDIRARTVRFRDLEKGDVIEVDYRLAPIGRLNPYGAYFGQLVAFQSAIPERLQRYVLITPADRTFNIHEERLPPPVVAVQDGFRVYRWEARNIAAVQPEPRGPALTELAPYVHVSTFRSWEEMGRWYAQLIRPQLELDAALREASAKLLAGAHTDQEKIRAIHDFVLRNTHYAALEFGIYGYKPYPVSETYARRFGDCKDKASLMVALLRAAGIQAELALVRTRRLGDIHEQPASIAIFDHAIVYVPRYDLWLDGTAEYSGLHELPIDDQGALALTVNLDGRAELRRIPISQPEENYTRRAVRAEIGNDGVIRFAGIAFTRGEDAPGLRRQYEVAERQRESFRDRLAEVFPTIRVEDVKVDGARDLDRDVEVDFRGELSTFAGQHSIGLAASWMPRSYVETLAPLASRTQELVLPAPWKTEEELRFALPRGATITGVPADTALETPFGAARLHYEQHERELVIRTSVEFRQIRITPQQYPSFRDFCAQLERAFRNEVKMVLQP